MAAEKKGGSGKKRKVKKTKQTAQKRAVAKQNAKPRRQEKWLPPRTLMQVRCCLQPMQALVSPTVSLGCIAVQYVACAAWAACRPADAHLEQIVPGTRALQLSVHGVLETQGWLPCCCQVKHSCSRHKFYHCRPSGVGCC